MLYIYQFSITRILLLRVIHERTSIKIDGFESRSDPSWSRDWSIEGVRDNARISYNRAGTVPNSGLRGVGVVDKRNLGWLYYRGRRCSETETESGLDGGANRGWRLRGRRVKKKVGRRDRGGSAILQRKPWRKARTVYHSASEFVVPRLVTSQSFLPVAPKFYPSSPAIWP